jgi:hypothetical protein
MSKNEPTPVKDLPWYESLRIFLEPYEPCRVEISDKTFTSNEIICAIESHHGVPQGVVGKEIYVWMQPDDFVRAMRYLGFTEMNVSGTQLEWVMRKK